MNVSGEKEDLASVGNAGPVGPAAAVVRTIPEPRPEGPVGEPGDLAPVVDACDQPGDPARPRHGERRVEQPRCERAHACPPVDEAHGHGRPRAQPLRVPVREELRLVGGHVDGHGAVGLARLAGETQVERLADRAVLPDVAPAAFVRVFLAVEHLAEKSLTAPRGEIFFPTAWRWLTWAHDAVVLAAAQAHAHAPQRCPGEGALVVREGKVRVGLRRAVAGPEAQVGDDRARIDKLPNGSPDLIGKKRAFHTLNFGRNISMTVQVENLGTEKACDFKVELWRSGDGFNLDELVDEQLVRGCIKGGKTKNIGLRYFSDASLSGSHVIYVIDSRNDIIEIDENNNREVAVIP